MTPTDPAGRRSRRAEQATTLILAIGEACSLAFGMPTTGRSATCARGDSDDGRSPSGEAFVLPRGIGLDRPVSARVRTP